MTHIPRRATQHGIFLSGCEVTPPVLKPGQTELQRQELYCKEAKAVHEPYLFQDQMCDSTYNKQIAKVTLPEDYKDPQKPLVPRSETCVGESGGTAHWVSEYKASLNQASSEEAEFGNAYELYKDCGQPPAMNGQYNVNSSYQEEFGKYRSNPRDRIGKIIKKPIDAGTTKGTMHIPGYQGFVPGNTFSEDVARVEEGNFYRSVDKTNIEQTYHTNVIGYSGHAPLSACNERGGRKPTTRTVYGHDYQCPLTSTHK